MGGSPPAIRPWSGRRARAERRGGVVERGGGGRASRRALHGFGSSFEGLSHSEVISISWDPHPREPVEGVLRATSLLELVASSLVWVWDAEGFEVLSWRRPDSPLSHCLSLRWFRSHIVVSGMRPQLGQAAVLRVLGVSVAALSRPSRGRRQELG
ncbi:hypothetical protein Taro_012038 [Colocasia esculenta]|uniref:Uncharacterized protein n=1 Tax=Colocasia esculenta TaxID=4460 RepID=A0A843U7Z8_COLES|nr:hypothetical protein [Colocasia esculenta]